MFGPDDERLDRTHDVLEREGPTGVKNEIQPVNHVVAHRPGNAHMSGWTFGLQSSRDVDAVAVQVGSFRDNVTQLDAHPELDAPIDRMAGVMAWHFTLQLDRATDRVRDAVKDDQQGVAGCLENVPAKTLDCRIEQLFAQRPPPDQRANIVQADQPAVADHVGVHDSNELASMWSFASVVRHFSVLARKAVDGRSLSSGRACRPR